MSKFTSKEIALSYMTANGEGFNSEDFLIKLYEAEKKFEELLKLDNPAERIKADRLEKLNKLVK